MKVLVRSQVRKRRIRESAVKEFTRFIMGRAGCPHNSELSVSFVGANAMRRLNRDYRGVDRDTDVLAFPLGEGKNGPVGKKLLGDVVISVDRAIAQARSWGTTLNHEVLLYLIHGILHLSGLDDRTSARREEMWKRQQAVLRAALKKRRWNVID